MTGKCISARLVEVRIQLRGKSNGVDVVVGYVPRLGSPVREKYHFGMRSTSSSQLFPVGITSSSSWVRTPVRASDRTGVPTVRCWVPTGVVK